MRKNLGVNMNDTKKREAWLRELKALRNELLSKKESSESRATVASSYPQAGRSYQKSTSGLASKMYEADKKQSAKIQVLMLALLTFLFETIFFVGSYFLFRK